MVDKKTVYIVLLIAVIVFGLGGIFQKNYPVFTAGTFSTISEGRPCSDWLSNQGMPSSITTPYNWGNNYRCITSIGMSNMNCQIVYTNGACGSASPSPVFPISCNGPNIICPNGVSLTQILLPTGVCGYSNCPSSTSSSDTSSSSGSSSSSSSSSSSTSSGSSSTSGSSQVATQSSDSSGFNYTWLIIGAVVLLGGYLLLKKK